VPFAPTDISECKLWLDAGTLTGSGGGTGVGGTNFWTDGSGQGNHATAPAVDGFSPKCYSGVVNGLNVVRFDGTNTYSVTLPNFMSGFTAGSVFLVLKDASGAGVESPTHWGTNGDSDYYPFGDGNIYVGDGSTARKSCGAPVTSLTAFHVFGVVASGSAWGLRLNQTSQFSAGSNTVGFPTAPALGRNKWIGDIAEVVVYDSALGTTDRQSVEDYLGGKYGLGFGGGAAGQPAMRRLGGVGGGRPVEIGRDGVQVYRVLPGDLRRWGRENVVLLRALKA
jgi:hypothetical protein